MANSLENQSTATENGTIATESIQSIRTARTVQSVERGFDILELLASSGRDMQLREIAETTGLNVSTCHHLLSTLVKRGYAGQNPRGRTYFVGSKVLELSDGRLRQFSVLDVAMPVLHDLNRATGESIHLAVMQGHDLTTLAKLDSTRPIRVATDGIGKTNAAHATATGKAILAWLPETEIARVIAEKGLSRFTDKTITGIAGLMEDLRHVRRNGFAVDREEFQPGVTCIGAAIRDHTGAVIGSISSSMPDTRASGDHFELVKEAVRDAAAILSELLGSPKEQSSRQTDAA